MNITYKSSKNFNSFELQNLFKSVNWLSANYAERLEKAINHSSTAISAWDGEQLIGLVNALDDSAMTAYVHYLLVNPHYQGQGIGKELIRRIKNRYEGYLYLLILAEEKDKVSFYTQLGFEVTSSTPLMIMTK